MARRRFARAGLALVAIASVTALAACDDSSSGGAQDDFNQSFQSGNRESSVHVGADAKVPQSFPAAAVPLPSEGALQAVVTGKDGKNHIYTLTYGLAGRNGVEAGSDYKSRLERAGFDIKSFTEERGSDGGFSTIDATSDRWDVFVVAGKASRRERAALSIQVATAGTLSGLADQTILGGSTTTTSAPAEPAP